MEQEISLEEDDRLKIIARKVLVGECDFCQKRTTLNTVELADGVKKMLCKHCAEGEGEEI